MNNDQYLVFETAAVPAMKRLMQALHLELVSLGLRCEPPAAVDHDIERGVALDIHLPDEELPAYVELLLTDGDERGFPRDMDAPECGVILSAFGPGGLCLGEWSPYNFTGQVATPDPQEIVRRIDLMDPKEFAAVIHARIADRFQNAHSDAKPRA